MIQYRLFNKKTLSYIDRNHFMAEQDALLYVQNAEPVSKWGDYTIHLLVLNNGNVVSITQFNIRPLLTQVPVSY